MAECSYARCLQERRLIKRELMKWSKDMLNIVGLERVAEELMGRRKWKHYQETLTRTHLNTDELTATIDQLNIESKTSEHNSKLDSNSISIKKEPPPQQQLAAQKEYTIAQQLYEENHRQGEIEEDLAKKHHRIAEDLDVKAIQIKRAASEIKEDISKVLTEKKEDNNNSNTTSNNHNNINNTNNYNNNTSSNTETVNITDEQDSCPTQHNHSDLLTNLRLRRVLKPESLASTIPPSASPSESKPEADQVEEEHPEPIDWKPNEKCYFCIDGKLLTVNDKGELVAESGPALSEADHANTQLIDTESDSNDSYAHDNTLRSNTGSSITAAAATSVPGNQRGANVNKLLASHLRDQPANMTSMDSMAARLAAIRSISGQLYPNLDFNWLLAQQQQQQQQQQANSATPTTSDTSATAISPVLKDSPGPSDATGEQPLDLSSKPSPNSSISGDLKSRSKPSRATPVPTARRTYSDDDLSNALQDIISGKLGTRKAAVQYNIPRSTLRNKVYKLTMDEKRLSNAPAPNEQLLQQLHQELELERDAHSGDEEESNDSTPQLDATHQPPPPPAPPLLDDLASRIAASATLRKLCESNNLEETQLNSSASPKPITVPTTTSPLDQLKRQTGQNLQAAPQTSPQPQMAPILIDPNVLLQTLLLSAGALQNSANLQPKLDETVTLRDLFGAILFNSGINLKDALAAATSTPSNTGDTLNNGSGKQPNMIDQRLLLQQLQQQASPASAHTHSHFAHRLPKSETPETSSSLDLNEASDDPSVILKIPSYKPVAGSSSSAAQVNAIPTSSAQSPSAAQQCSANVSTSRNGDSPHSQRSAQSPRIATSMLAAAVAAATGGGNMTSAHQQPNSISVISPPLMRHNLSADSQSPPSFSLRDVIANSIHRTMNEQANKDAHAAAASMLGLGAGSDSERNTGSDYKTPSISVVKNIGGTDTSRFGKAPNLLTGSMAGHNSHHHHHHHQHHHLQHAHHSTHHLSRQEAAALAAGKGTRPKRGKYRNYDRDSLVEAVKAVQRGEMSVHRAGSYYGVPHSTLEYKVKERHLMRPRKREPKPQPLDGTATTSSASKSNSNIPGHSTANNLDKLKGNASNASSNSKLSGALKNNSGAAAYANTSPNGMKLSMFDPNVAAAQMQYAPHLFWPHSAAAFGPMQMDFNRNAAQSSNTAGNVNSATTAPGGSASPYVNADILKSHIQRYQEETMRSASASSTNAHKSAHTPSPIASPMPGQNHHALSYKSARELAENIYDSGGNANGSTSSSFLDGIIRKTLDRKSNDVAPPSSGGALLDQLLVKKIPLPFTNNRSNDYATTSGAPLKRSGSPLASAYGSVDIKRERSSPLNSDEASNSEVDEHNNNNNSRLAGGNDGRTCVAARHRMTSRDSDTDGSSGSFKSGMPSELLTSQHYNNSSSTNITDLNGGAASKVDIGSVGTSILQEKLGQIKAERDSEENL